MQIQRKMTELEKKVQEKDHEKKLAEERDLQRALTIQDQKKAAEAKSKNLLDNIKAFSVD